MRHIKVVTRQHTCKQYLTSIMRGGDGLLKPAALVLYLRLFKVWALSLDFIEKNQKGEKQKRRGFSPPFLRFA